MRQPTKDEISYIRKELFTRQKGLCLWCGARLTSKMAHMHERLFRGKGGKISLDNSIILCYSCHMNDAHGDRKPKFGGKK